MNVPNKLATELSLHHCRVYSQREELIMGITGRNMSAMDWNPLVWSLQPRVKHFPFQFFSAATCWQFLYTHECVALSLPPPSRMIGLPAGIISFLLAKREVDKNRLKQLKVRQRMRNSNEGDYEGSRYHRQAEDVKLDRWCAAATVWFPPHPECHYWSGDSCTKDYLVIEEVWTLQARV